MDNEVRIESKIIESVSSYISAVKKDTESWTKGGIASDRIWFRGQDREDGPIPKLFRNTGYDEFELTRIFRERAGAFGNVPEVDRRDKWLYLMQHYGAATRLLDWTESALIALFFAIDSHSKLQPNDKYLFTPTVWAIHPLELNKLSGVQGFPNTWSPVNVSVASDDSRKIENINPGVEYFRLAFHPQSDWSKYINLDIAEIPIAVRPIYLDMRMYSQRSCFTIHGTDDNDLESILCSKKSTHIIRKYKILPDQCEVMFRELHQLGINKATIFPDMSGLAEELTDKYRRK